MWKVSGRRGGYARLWSVLAGPLMALGCGDPTDAGHATTTTADFAQSFARSYCRSIASCCTRQGFATGDCETTLQVQVRAQLQVSTSNPKIQYNPDAAAACLDAYAAALSACTDSSKFAQLDQVCNAVLVGTVPAGGACGRSAECAKPATGYVSCTTGVCVPSESTQDLFSAPHRKLGESCGGTCEGLPHSASCGSSPGEATGQGACWLQDGVFCSNGVCARTPQVGEACASLRYCEGAAHCVASVCVADLSSGPCTQDNQCLAPSICDSTLQMCVPLKENGQPCDDSEQCLGGECYEDHCRTWTVAQTNTCLGVLDD